MGPSQIEQIWRAIERIQRTLNEWAARDNPSNLTALNVGTATGAATGEIHTSALASLTTPAESWVGPSSTAGIYFKGGNVGIGTANPQRLLEIDSRPNTPAALRLTRTNNTGTDGQGYASLDYLPSGALSSSNVSWGSGLYPGDNNYSIFSFDGTNNATRLVIQNSGNVGIGTAAPSYQLQLSTDSAAKPTTSTWTVASDVRVKKNIRAYTEGLDIIKQINPIRYQYNGLANLPENAEGIGLDAKAHANILKDCIGKYKTKLKESDPGETELYNFNSHALTFLLVNAVKELDARLALLESAQPA